VSQIWTIFALRRVSGSDTGAGALPPARHKEVKRALGYALAWDELIDLGSGAG